MPSFTDLRSDLRWLSAGFLLMLFSGFGQTFYIALFAGQLKSSLAISDGQFGGLYTLGTLASAVVLTVSGRFADTVPIRWLSAAVLAGLAVTSLAMAWVSAAWMLALVIFGLRYFGQGMLSVTAMTAMGRWFNRKRGRAVAVAGMGMPTGQAVLPPLAVAAMAMAGWRESWMMAAALLALVAVPLFMVLLRHERHPTRGPRSASGEDPDLLRHQWTRGEVLRDRSFWCLMPAVLAPPYVLTAVFFNQVTLVDIKGWKLEWFAGTFSLLAVVSVIASLTTGWLVDRVGARRLPAIYLSAMGLGTLLLAGSDAPAALFVVMALYGVSMGASAPVSGAIWPELYGITHLGSIKSAVAGLVVVATAIAPGVAGVLLDAGVALELQLLVMGVVGLAMAAWVVLLVPMLDRVVESGRSRP